MYTDKNKLPFATWLGFSASFILLSSINCIAGNTKSSKPNFLILISDDQRWDQISYPGNQIIPELKTPNLDKLASRGVYFSNAFVTSPICAVSRASIMTGRYAGSHGMNHFNTPLKEEVIMNTFPALLKRAGYRTGILGKWGMGMAGTDKIFDVCNAWADQGTYFLNTDNGKIHNSEWLALKTREFLGSCRSDHPFCLTVCFKAPHHPYQPDGRDSTLFEEVNIPKRKSDTPEAYAGMSLRVMEGSLNRWCYFDERKDEKTKNAFEKNFLQCVAGLDRSVGKIMGTLHELNLDENTVVIFLSDNGYIWGEHGLGGKWILYEESIRIPMIIRWPGMPEKYRGKCLQQLVLNTDVAPTILDMAGIIVPEVMNGKSLLPIINHPESDFRKDFFMEHDGIVKAEYPIPDSYGIRTKQWKYIRYVNIQPEVEEMYNLSTDPLELKNLIDDKDFIGVKNDLRKRYKYYTNTVNPLTH
jgi:arylsulfatase A-like enzyme